jgi:aldehyde:ferredoxin oxidoreductase
MELSGVNPKGCASMGFSLATADFASHTRFWSATAEMQGLLTVDSVPKFVKEGQDEVAARNSLIVCDFLPFGFDRLAPLFSALTGMEVDPAGLMKIGERIEKPSPVDQPCAGADGGQASRAFLFGTPLRWPFCRSQLHARGFSALGFREYYRLRGWDERGVPTPEKLADLGLPGPRLCQL